VVHDFGQSEGLYYLVMEYVDGANLRVLMRSGELQSEQALAIVPRICDALQYAHDEGVVHRDIKPENVLLDKRGRVKIADFGLAKLLGRDAADQTMITDAGMSLGTPRYMAPEQVEHPERVDHRADIYSLGVVFYEMLTGELPMGRFEPPSAKVQVDVRLDEVVLRSLERDVERRYQHASEVKTDVEDITGVIERMPPAMRQMMGVEYRSARTLFGLPLLHIAHGVDPRTGIKRVARGIVAIGDNAVGVIALGGIARGGFAFGGVAVGVIAVGGCAAGLLSMGGLALGLILANGGLAIGTLAWGGAAVGYLAMGGGAFGVHYAGGNGSDAIGAAAFRYWAPIMQKVFWLSWAVFIPGMLVGIFGRIWAAQRLGSNNNKTNITARAAAQKANPASATPVPRSTLNFTISALWLITLIFGANLQSTWNPQAHRISFGAVQPWLVISKDTAYQGAQFDFLSWSFLSFVASGFLFSALLRLHREDKGTISRDPVWWKHWSRSFLLWAGLLLVAVCIRSVTHAIGG
jgi:hypothetical protein